MCNIVDVKHIKLPNPKMLLGRIRGAMKRGGRRKQRVETGSWVIYTLRDFEVSTRGNDMKVDIVGLVDDERVLS